VAFKYACHPRRLRSCLIMPKLNKGSAFALVGNLEEGIDESTKVVQIGPHTAKAYKVGSCSHAERTPRHMTWPLQRRGQTKSAAGDLRGAKDDLDRALQLAPEDVDTYHQRVSNPNHRYASLEGPDQRRDSSWSNAGLVLHKMRDFRLALCDFRRVVGSEELDKKVYFRLVQALTASASASTLLRGSTRSPGISLAFARRIWGTSWKLSRRTRKRTSWDPQSKEALLSKVRVKPSVREARAAWGDPAYELERF
jgi:tetratricopeptide (TPR) repeat protein